MSASHPLRTSNNQLISGHGDRSEVAQWLALRGTAYYRLKDYQRAGDDYTEAVRLFETSVAE